MNVVVAIIRNKHDQVLITQRSNHTDHAGFWEFPGGKIEAGESQFLALYREVKEEVGLEIMEATFLQHVSYDYKYKQVNLFFYSVSSFSGSAKCCEQQQNLKWVNLEKLSDYKFPEANLSFISWLQNPVSVNL